MTAPPAPADTRLGLRGDRGPILGALMLSTALVALDVTILATASTTVARELEERGHVGSAHRFLIMAKVFGSGDPIQAGEFLLPGDKLGRHPRHPSARAGD